MKQALIIFLFLVASESFAQSNPEDTIILRIAIPELKKQRLIVYADTVNKECRMTLPKDMVDAIKKGMLTDMRNAQHSDTLVLSVNEKKYLLKQLKKTTVWENNLFENSKRISGDSLFDYATNEGRKYYKKLSEAKLSKDTIALAKLSQEYPYFPYAFGFTKPVYLRNNTICFISFVAICGNPCGRSASGIYKKDGNEWKLWIGMPQGDF
jgi:hypothetical protein